MTVQQCWMSICMPFSQSRQSRQGAPGELQALARRDDIAVDNDHDGSKLPLIIGLGFTSLYVNTFCSFTNLAHLHWQHHSADSLLPLVQCETK